MCARFETWHSGKFVFKDIPEVALHLQPWEIRGSAGVDSARPQNLLTKEHEGLKDLPHRASDVSFPGELTCEYVPRA